MKTQKEWFDEYAVSHQNKTNQTIHYICVPAIYFSIVGLIMSFPTAVLTNLIDYNNSIWINWATIILIPVLLFYLKMSFITFIRMLIFTIICFIVNHHLSHFIPLFYISLAIFLLAWIGQFYGHKLEGKKPSFFKDLQFLLIGPAWVFEKLSR